MKPRVFVGSSIEGLNVAYAVQSNLHHTSDVTVWDQGVFTPSRYTLDAIVRTVAANDYAVFVFSPDDETTMRGDTNRTVRDNVLFELGVAVGKLGRERAFFVVPEGVNIHVPTDLLGVTPVTYRHPTTEGQLQAAVGHACNQIRNAIHAPREANRRLEIPFNDRDAIRQYMYDWIQGGGRVAIFSRDLSWAQEPRILELLQAKAKANELLICAPEMFDLAAQLPGAQVFIYSAIGYVPQSRFTFVHYGRGGARVAVGLPHGTTHVIQEFDANDPAYYMAEDLLEFAISAAKERAR